jgi:toxin-antitoxin system PIN domain toxin
MIACDTNILYYSIDQSCKEHSRAVQFLEKHAENEDFSVCELNLIELYVLLRNPKMHRKPATAEHARSVIESFRSNPFWRVLDYPGNLMNEIWEHAWKKDAAYRDIFDTRIALTLLHHGVQEFATRNLADFGKFGFRKVWDPLNES